MATLIELAQTDPAKARKRINQMRSKATQEGLLEGSICVLGSKGVAVEWGAGVGELALRIAKTGVKFYVFEADPLASARARENLNAFDNVEMHEKAVSLSNEPQKLYRDVNFAEDQLETTLNSGLLGVADTRLETEIEVPSVNGVEFLETLISENGYIDFLAIDINGSELELIEEMIERNVFAHIKVTFAKSYQRDFQVNADRYRAIRTKIEEHPEWNIHFEKV